MELHEYIIRGLSVTLILYLFKWGHSKYASLLCPKEWEMLKKIWGNGGTLTNIPPGPFKNNNPFGEIINISKEDKIAIEKNGYILDNLVLKGLVEKIDKDRHETYKITIYGKNRLRKKFPNEYYDMKSTVNANKNIP